MTLRVAIVDPAAWSLTYDVPLAEALARAGAHVTIHTTSFAHGEMPAPTDGVEVSASFYRQSLRPLPRRAARALQHPVDLHGLVRRLKRDGTDVVHVQWMPVRRFDAAAWSKLAQQVPVVFTVHNAQGRTGRVPAELLRGFSAVVAHTAGGASSLREAGIAEVWHEPIGAFTSYANMPDPDPLPVDVPDGAPLVVLAGLLRPYKGVDVLLDAWPAVRRAVPGARLVIAGRPMGVELPATPPDGATLLPRFLTEAEYGWLLRRADVCCLPYREIDMSGVAASALACGTPLVLSNVGGLDEFDGQGALLVPPGDAATLAATLAQALGSPELQERLRAEAAAAIAGRFSWDAIAARYLEHYRSL